MEVAELAGAVLLFSLGSHLAVRVAPTPWQRAKRQRRERALRRLSEIVRAAQLAQPPPSLPPTTWQASDFKRYFVPMGLRLEQARQVIREARELEMSDAHC